MLSRLRTVALLMLLAGAALGVFGTRALTRAPGDEVRPPNSYAPRIEEKVKQYTDVRDLTAEQADRIRSTLVEYDRSVHALIMELRKQHAGEFESRLAKAVQQIAAVLKETEGK